MAQIFTALSFAIHVQIPRPANGEELENSTWRRFNADKFPRFVKKADLLKAQKPLCVFEGAVASYSVQFFLTLEQFVEILQTPNGFWKTAPTYFISYFILALQRFFGGSLRQQNEKSVTGKSA